MLRLSPRCDVQARAVPAGRLAETRGPLVVYGAGSNQLPVLAACRREGWRTIAIDRNPRAPGARLADRFVCLSLHDHTRILAALEAEPIAGVVARITDREALGSACSLARSRGLPAPCAALEQAATSKRAIALHAGRAGLATPRRFTESEAREALGAPGTGGTALILRPDVTIRGKAGIRRIASSSSDATFSDATFREALEQARSLSANARVDVAEWIEGIDVSVLVRLVAGEATSLATWDEWVAVDRDGWIRGVGVAMPSLAARHADEIDRAVRDLARAFPESRGLFVLSLRVDGGGRVWLIEIHLGIGGDGIAEQLLPAVTPGWDAFASMVKAQTLQDPSTTHASADDSSGGTSGIRPRALLRDGAGWRLVEAESPASLRALCRASLPADWEPPMALRAEPAP